MSSAHNFAHLLPPSWKNEVHSWLKDDVPSFDVGGFVVGEKEEVAFLLGKSSGILSGVPFFDAVFEALDCKVEWLLPEGSVIDPWKATNGKIIVAKVSGKSRNILLGERTALNILTRASGIATQANKAVALAASLNWHGTVAGTRKTTPGFRLVEKYSLLVAGASTHRHDLSQMVMLKGSQSYYYCRTIHDAPFGKDNHIWSAGSITNAVTTAKRAAGFSMKIEVECRSLDEAMEAANAGADIVMLDNFVPENLKAVAKEVKEKYPHITIEASGGITLDSMHLYTSPYVDVISQGSLTQGYPCLDFSLKIQRSDGVV